MRTALFGLIIFTAFLNFSCRRNVESSPLAVNERVEKTPEPAPTPDKYEEIAIFEYSDSQPDSLEYNDFKVERVSIRKTDGRGNPVTDIKGAVITKKGKKIAEFAGLYNPLGNDVNFALAQFLSGSEKQLLIVDWSYRYDHAWIVSLSPKFEVIFDAADYDVLYSGLRTIDIDNDGEKEITLRTSSDVFYGFTNIDQPWVQVIFKYDAEARKYLPASHLFADFTLSKQAEQIRKFNENEKKSFPEVMQIVLTYIYAGKEAEAWKFFDENLPEPFTHYGMELKKEQARAKISAALNQEPIYKFIKADLKKNKR